MESKNKNNDSGFEASIKSIYNNTYDKNALDESVITHIKESKDINALRRKTFSFKRNAILIAAALLLCVGISAYSIIVHQADSSPSDNSKLVANIPLDVFDGTIKQVDLEGGLSSLGTTKNYSDLYDYISVAANNYKRNNKINISTTDDNMSSSKDLLESSPNSSTNNSDDGVSDYSNTNIQVEGVDEADIVKTDGEYIYYIHKDTLYKVKVLNGKLTETAHTKFTTESKDHDYCMYITKESITVIQSCYSAFAFYNSPYDLSVPQTDEKSTEDQELNNGNKLNVYIFSNDNELNLLNEYTAPYDYSDSRLIGNYLYLTATMYISHYNKADINTYVPSYTAEGTLCYLASDDIFIEPSIDLNIYSSNYTIIMSIDITSGDVTDTKSIYGFSPSLYCSSNNLYLYCNKMSYDSIDTCEINTKIYKYSLDNGVITYKADTIINGDVIDQFSLDEYNGNLRIATTCMFINVNSSTYSIVTTLDSNLKKLDEITNIAPDESIYSARFIGDYGYIVTFFETDPLFTIDMADASNISIIDELKVPGFSTYLQGFGNDRLLGIGYDDNRYIKVSMFNIVDKKNVFDESTFINNEAVYSSALGNHKALLVNYEKNLIGFDVTYYFNSNNENGNVFSYLLYSYDSEKGFILKAVLPLTYDNLSPCDKTRGLFIGDYFYTISDSTLISYSLSSLLDDNASYEQIDSFVF